MSAEVVVVTGASGGVGRATAIEFGRRGAYIALLARGAAGLRQAADAVEAAGGHAIAIPTDVSDPAQVCSALERVEQEWGSVDVWVNVAFTSVFSPFDQLEPDEFRRATEVTYLGYVYGTMAVLPRMQERGSGTIVHVGSALAYRGIPLQSVYCGAKHAIQGFHESLRCELLHAKSPVHVTMVQLPAANTPQFSWVRSRLPRRPQPVPPIFQPEVAARAIVYAARHPRRREYWVGGSTAMTLVANAVAPGLLDRYLARTGFDSQQTAEARDPNQPENLWAPADVARDFGTHGRFDDKAKTRSTQLWASQHHGLLGAVSGAALAVTAGALSRRPISARAGSRSRRS